MKACVGCKAPIDDYRESYWSTTFDGVTIFYCNGCVIKRT